MSDHRLSLISVPELDGWKARAEAREKERLEALLKTRLRCPVCGELGVWYLVKVRDGKGQPIPDGAYCWEHSAPNGGASADVAAGGYMSLNHYGWLPDGSTWTEGFPQWE